MSDPDATHPAHIVESDVARSFDGGALVADLTRWYRENRRDLPWRAPDRSAWGVLMSEFMLQQTPVSRVLPVWQAWMRTWPNPNAFASADVSDVLRAWGRLGYPRRALRLHQAATAIVDVHDGQVPTDEPTLRSLPGVGEYTAAAVVAFAYNQRSVVLDTNIRRVLTRVRDGQARPTPGLTASERQRAADLVPDDGADAALWSVAVMEFGALVCTALRPKCDECPIAEMCLWRSRGFPEDDLAPRRSQPFNGTDRQVRGRVMAILRDSEEAVEASLLSAAWADEKQLAGCIASLVSDGLIQELADGRYALGATPSSMSTP